MCPQPWTKILARRLAYEGNIHHTAIVTAVVDGHIYYTQHSTPQQNADLNLREPLNAQRGNQTVRVVQPAGG